MLWISIVLMPIQIRLSISMPIQIRILSSVHTCWKVRNFYFIFICSSAFLYCFIFLANVIGIIIINIFDSLLKFSGKNYGSAHRLNMELDLQSFVGLHVYICIHWLRPRTLPPPPHLGSYTRALLVSQDRRHLFVTPWYSFTFNLKLIRIRQNVAVPT